jgi:hypothetical protein
MFIPYAQAKSETVQLTKDEAIAKSKNITKASEALFIEQLMQKYRFMNFSIFHESAEIALKRPVFLHEFAKLEVLWNELHGKRNSKVDPFSTLLEVLNG